ncbi:MAG TPA: RNA polymerase sigma factor RpoD/SigA, partial [Flavisolibacter sp.]|nr:RNA polymerase sigma factor RpoD/SigA [Flavisolibacter sp.]
SKSLDKYLQEIGKTNPITADEEVLLAQRIKQGDQHALTALTMANLRFVVSVAKQYQAQGIPLSDLINEGNIGLMKAAQRFDETKGFKFISYAVWWIRQSIIQSIMENGRIIHLPMNKKALYMRILKAQAVLQNDLEREPSNEELAAFLEVNADEIEITISSNAFHASLDAPLLDGQDGTLADTLLSNGSASDHKLTHHGSLHIELRRYMSILSKTEQEIICKLFGIGLPESSLTELSIQFNLSTERIRQIKQRALKKLKDSPRSPMLKSYLGS